MLAAFAAQALLATTLHAQTWSVAYLHPAGADHSQLTSTTGGQQAGNVTFGVKAHAGIWAGSAASFTDLSPDAVATKAYANATTGALQAGYTELNDVEHAAIWAGPGGFTNLNPVGADESKLIAANGGQQAGTVTIGAKLHAGIWYGTAGSFIDLTPSAVATRCYVWATSGSQQAGFTILNDVAHATIWAGYPESGQSIHPDSATSSQLTATTGAQQAGYATIGGDSHAGIWAGTKGSFRDLHPAGATFSYLTETTGARQAGYVYIGGANHAGIWAGTAASFLDLHAFLSSNYSSSQARSIWSDGATILVAGNAYNSTANRDEAILWKLTPNRLPTIAVTGKKNRATTAPKLVIKGSASDIDGNLLRVEFKAGNAKYKKAKGTAQWKFTARLEPGKNKILVRGVDTAGAASPPARLTVIRK